jgi:hypothetical protein
MSTSSAASDAAVEAIVAEFRLWLAGTGVVRGGDVLLRQQARKFLSWLPEARSRSRGIQVKPDDVGDLGDRLGIGGEFERLGAPGLDSVVSPQPPCRSRFPNAGPTAANSSV